MISFCHKTVFVFTAVTTVTTVTTVNTVNTVTTVTIFTYVTTIIVKYQMLLLYSSKGNLFTKFPDRQDPGKAGGCSTNTYVIHSFIKSSSDGL